MTTLNDFSVADGNQYVLAAYYNLLLGSILRKEFSNAVTMSATLTLTDGDTAIQRLNCNGANRIVKMPPGANGNHPFFIINITSSGSWTLTVQSNDGATTHHVLTPGEAALVIPDGNGGYKNAVASAVRLSSDSPRIYTSNATWTKPAGLVYVIVELVGGGAAGGGAAVCGATEAACGSAGGGGEYAKGKFLAVFLGSSETIMVGPGGTGSPGANGTSGGNSSFGTHISANGGAAGVNQGATVPPANGSIAGGAGGSGGSGGNIRIPGSCGIPGALWSTSAVTPSIGGFSHLSGQAKTTSTAGTDEDGAAGAQYGGGGSGARNSNSGTARAGGNGANGVVIVWEFIQG